MQVYSTRHALHKQYKFTKSTQWRQKYADTRVIENCTKFVGLKQWLLKKDKWVERITVYGGTVNCLMGYWFYVYEKWSAISYFRIIGR